MRKPLIVLAFICVGVVMGYIVFKQLHNYTTITDDTNYKSRLTNEMGTTITRVLNIFGLFIGIGNDVELLSFDGILALIAALCSVLLFVVFPIFQIKNFKNEDFTVKVYTLFVIVHVSELLVLMIFNKGMFVERYALSGILLLISLGSNFLYNNFLSNPRMNLQSLISILLIVLYILPPAKYNLSLYDNYSERMDSRKAITNHLNDLGLDFGYATYWNSSVNTYLSNGKVEINAVNIYDDKLHPYFWLNSKQRYTEEAHSGKSFLLLTEYENTAFENSIAYNRLGEPILIDSFNGYYIYAYDYNISYDDFSGKQFQAHILKTMIDNGAQRNQDGSITMVQGDLINGPYMSLLKGTYNVNINVDSLEDPLYFHFSKNCGEVIQSGTLHNGDNSITLSLDSDIIQFEVYIRNDYENTIKINDVFIEEVRSK